MGLSDWDGPVIVTELAPGVTYVGELRTADVPTRFMPDPAPTAWPELFRAVVRNNEGPNGEDWLGLRIAVMRPWIDPLASPTADHVLAAILDHDGWEDMHLTGDDMPCGATLGHELIRHGYMMVNRDSFAAGVVNDMPHGCRVAGWERYPGTAAWFTYVYRREVA